MNFIFFFFCQNFLNNKDMTFDAFLRDNMAATMQLSVLVLQAQDRLFITGYAKKHAELEGENHFSPLALDLLHDNDDHDIIEIEAVPIKEKEEENEQEE